jgi:hypothetical protein
MARFITRVELHGAANDDYEVLHEAMEAEGFRRTITSGDGTVYHLPTAEYYWETPRTREEVIEAGKRAASKTEKEFGIIVTEAKVSSWSGLPKVAD